MQHLQAELLRLNVLIQREVRRWQLAAQDPNDRFRGLYLSDEQATALLERPFGASWGQTATLTPEEEQAFVGALANAQVEAAMLAQRAQAAGQPTRLQRLAEVFNLTQFDLDAWLICLAPALDLRYETLYGYLQDDITRKLPTVNLLLSLLSEPGAARLPLLAHFSDNAPLFRHALLEKQPLSGNGPLLGKALVPDPAIVAWLLGAYQPRPDLSPHVGLQHPTTTPELQLLAGDLWAELAPVVSKEPAVVFYGANSTTQYALSYLAAGQLNRPLLTLDLTSVARAEMPLDTALALALRDAQLLGATPLIQGWDTCFVNGTPPPTILAAICAFPGAIFIAGNATWSAQGIERERTLFWIETPLPAYPQRLMLWQHFLGNVPEISASEVEDIAGQFLLSTGQIRDAVATARDNAARKDASLTTEDLFVAARQHSNPHLSELARKITPRYTWDDIILPGDELSILRELVSTVRGRPKVLETWGVGKKLASGNGITVLFAGPPGTGKTMAAEVIAAELHLDLYKIDLSTVVSKYIGETEKNLERIFSEAQSSNAILFFDEADALFGKRSEVKDAHDRYANIEISYLLQRMESYDGVTILATNLRANLDEAFARRLQFAVDFPFPEEEYRMRIWETLFPPEVPREDNIDFAYLARNFKMAGGNIRNVLVSAAFLSAADDNPVNMAHLRHGMRRELQKMGRLVKLEDL